MKIENILIIVLSAALLISIVGSISSPYGSSCFGIMSSYSNGFASAQLLNIIFITISAAAIILLIFWLINSGGGEQFHERIKKNKTNREIASKQK